MDEIEKTLNNFLPDKAEKSIVILNEEQKNELLSMWRNSPQNSPPKLKKLVEKLWPNTNLDGRSSEAKAVKDFLANYKIFPETNVHNKIGEYELTVAEKEFIQNNLDAMKVLEMAKTLWGRGITPLAKEFRALNKFYKSLSFKPQVNNTEEKQNTENFTPPKTYTECLRLVNKYNHDILSSNDISEQEKQGINTLIRYLHSPRLIKTISTFHDENNRNLFLSEFIRATYNKPDLTVDEVNLYISLAASYPLEHLALSEREVLSRKLQGETEDGRISANTVEAINAKNKEYQDCQVRQEKLINTLNGSRSKRLENQVAANTSILPLIKYWAEEKNRENFIALAKMKKSIRIQTIEKLLTVDSVIAEIYGAVEES